MVLYSFEWNRSHEGRATIRPLTIAFGEGTSATIGYSADGIYWNSCNNEAFSVRANHGCWNGTVWVGVGTGGNWVATSYDGINWTGQDNSILSEGYHVAWNGTVFLAAGAATSSTSQTTLAISTDGLAWSAVSSDVFSSAATWVGWTGNVWCATGYYGNTTATCTSIYGNVWTGNGSNYMNTMTDLSSIIVDDGGATYTCSSAATTVDPAFDNTWTSEWRSASASYDATGSPTNCEFTTAIGSATNTVSGEYLQIACSSAKILDYYLLVFNVSGGYETPKSWYLLGANSASPTYWTTIDYRYFSMSTPPSYGPNGYYTVPIAINSSTAYQYYRLVITGTFNNGAVNASYYARITEMDLFYDGGGGNINSPIRVKAMVTPNGVSYPIKLKSRQFLVYADQTNTQISPAIHGTSYYATDISGAGFDGMISASAYDGTNCIIASTSTAGNNMYYTADFGKTWNNMTTTVENNNMQIYSAAFNGTYFIIGGNSAPSSASGNVLMYGKTENGINTWYSCLNSKKIFTRVNGIASNSGYGYTVPNNSVYFDLGDKMNIITPRSYPSGVAADTQIAFNLNTFPVSFL